MTCYFFLYVCNAIFYFFLQEITKGETVIQNIKPLTKLEKELEFTRLNKAKWTSKVDRHMDLAKKAAVPSGWK